jgi:hypothetical protein
MALERVARRTGMGERQAKHHMRILEAFGLIGKREEDGGLVVYALHLDDQPAWVSMAIKAHRPPQLRRSI